MLSNFFLPGDTCIVSGRPYLASTRAIEAFASTAVSASQYPHLVQVPWYKPEFADALRAAAADDSLSSAMHEGQLRSKVKAAMLKNPLVRRLQSDCGASFDLEGVVTRLIAEIPSAVKHDDRVAVSSGIAVTAPMSLQQGRGELRRGARAANLEYTEVPLVDFSNPELCRNRESYNNARMGMYLPGRGLVGVYRTGPGDRITLSQSPSVLCYIAGCALMDSAIVSGSTGGGGLSVPDLPYGCAVRVAARQALLRIELLRFNEGVDGPAPKDIVHPFLQDDPVSSCAAEQADDDGDGGADDAFHLVAPPLVHISGRALPTGGAVSDALLGVVRWLGQPSETTSSSADVGDDEWWWSAAASFVEPYLARPGQLVDTDTIDTTGRVGFAIAAFPHGLQHGAFVWVVRLLMPGEVPSSVHDPRARCGDVSEYCICLPAQLRSFRTQPPTPHTLQCPLPLGALTAGTKQISSKQHVRNQQPRFVAEESEVSGEPSAEDASMDMTRNAVGGGPGYDSLAVFQGCWVPRCYPSWTSSKPHAQISPMPAVDPYAEAFVEDVPAVASTSVGNATRNALKRDRWGDDDASSAVPTFVSEDGEVVVANDDVVAHRISSHLEASGSMGESNPAQSSDAGLASVFSRMLQLDDEANKARKIAEYKAKVAAAIEECFQPVDLPRCVVRDRPSERKIMPRWTFIPDVDDEDELRLREHPPVAFSELDFY